MRIAQEKYRGEGAFNCMFKVDTSTTGQRLFYLEASAEILLDASFDLEAKPRFWKRVEGEGLNPISWPRRKQQTVL